MMRPILLALTFVSALAAQTPDWTAINGETLKYFTDLIRIDTSSPPGNETVAAQYVARVLEHEGIPSKLVGSDPKRQSLIARLKGNGSKRPILIMGHTDVVGVQREKWAQDPFGAARIDGFIWGRGTLDDKDNLVASLMTILLLKRAMAQNPALTLDRDVIFVAESDEEAGGTLGIVELIKNNWSEIEAEYCLAEAGGFSSRDGKVTHQTVQLGEKMPRQMKMTVQGTAGHGSQPREDNAIVHLSGAVARLGAWQPPMRLNDITRSYFELLPQVSTPEDAQRFKDLFNSAKSQSVQDYFRKNDIFNNSVLRTTVSPNIIDGGFRANVIPSQASATLDVRALPDEDMAKFQDQMRTIIADPTIKLEATGIQAQVSPPSKMDTEMYRTLGDVQKRIYPGTVLIPSMSTGATDMRGLRSKGVMCYGIGSEVPKEDLLTHAVHSDNERIKESGLYQFVRYQYEVDRQIAAHAAQ
jgi:acetylornithine deacetylase/succinyl-diaminopimelate desuccinylase-like protein